MLSQEGARDTGRIFVSDSQGYKCRPKGRYRVQGLSLVSPFLLKLGFLNFCTVKYGPMGCFGMMDAVLASLGSATRIDVHGHRLGGHPAQQ